MGTVMYWVSVDKASQAAAPGATVTFNLTIKVPANTAESNYVMWLYFNAIDQSNFNHSFNYNPQTIIVDNSPPVELSFSYDQTSTKIDVYNWSAFDSQSSIYTDEDNNSSGLMGIATYKIAITDTNNAIKDTISIKATDYNSHTFTGLTANTNYKVSVTATDLAGNSDMLEKSVTTAPPAPTLSVSDTNFRSITLG